MNMERKFIYADDKSNKFWTIESEGSSYTVKYGKVGTAGKTQTEVFTDEDACKKAVEKLIAAKIKKGYVETDELLTTAKTDKPAAKRYRTFVKAFETEEDKEDDDEDYMVNVINVDDKDHVIAAIETLIKKIKDTDFLEEIEERGLRFGIVKNKILVDEIYSFYNYAAKYEDVRPLLQKLCKQIIDENYDNSGCPSWEDEETLFGVRPAFALAMIDKKYIDTAIDMMCSMYNGDHATPADYSSDLYNKWGPCAETIKYFAASVIAMPMQELAVQVFAALNNEGYKEYLKDPKNIDLFFKYYAEYMGTSVHFDYKQEHKRKHLLGWVIPDVFKHLFTDGDKEKAAEIGKKFVDLLLEGKQPTYQMLFENA
jgi:predicted DNA-binding WGR domain protein